MDESRARELLVKERDEVASLLRDTEQEAETGGNDPMVLGICGWLAFQMALAVSAIGFPASSPKLKQALNTPEIMATSMPRPNLYSVLPGAPCGSVLTVLDSCFSFIIPALPQKMFLLSGT